MSEEFNVAGRDENMTADDNYVPEQSAEAVQNEVQHEWSSLVGENGAFADNWRDFLPEDIRNERCFDSLHTFGAMAKSYVHSQKALGGKRFAMPDANSTPEELGELYAALGRPESPEGYSTDIELPEGVTLDEAQVEGFRKVAHEYGLSDKAFQKILALDVERTRAAVEAQERAAEQEYNNTVASLKRDYGDGWEDVVAQCNKTIETFQLKQILAEKGLLSNYALIKALADIGGKISESRIKAGDTPFIAPDPARELEQLQADMAGPLYNREHPGHELALKRQAELLAQLVRRK